MQDIPMFTSEYGVASLFLREIPYRGRAHIKIQSSLEPEKLLEECIAFCRMCGAEWIDAAGHAYLEKFPLITTLSLMTRALKGLPEMDACLFPVTAETMQRWLDIYNERMADIPNAAYMDSKDGKQLLERGSAYFVHKNGELLGVGIVTGDFIDTVISVKAGAGETVLRNLASVLTEDTVRLMVADANTRAVRLYERLGFIKVKEMSRWYRVL
ncbi:MAG: hypothetical protein IKY59_03220 [Oscillospiraceae bacterium]|nr:hypothetical protein [Oscillospiraceae bacterium]